MEIGGSAVISAHVAAHLGLKPIFIGKVGRDFAGEYLQKLMKESGIHSALLVTPRHQTNLSLNYVNADGKNLLTAVGSANQALSAPEVMKYLEKHLEQVRYLYLGSYFKLKQLSPVYPQMIALAHAKGAKVVLDHGRITESVTDDQLAAVREIVKAVDFYFPSEDEFKKVWDVHTVRQGLTKLRSQTKAKVAVKCGRQGALGLDRKGTIVKVPGFKVKPINTVGAGDSFNAGFLSAQVRGLTFLESLQSANATAAVKISQPQLPTLADVKKMLQSEL
jgi:sugar/nucleoside kinase (ribokinase family)